MVIVAVGGVSGSGKTSLVNSLDPVMYGFSLTVFHQDDYYKDSESEDWDVPEALDNQKLLCDISLWKQTHDGGSCLLVIEGFLCLLPEIVQLCDQCFFLYLGKEECKVRRFARDGWIRENPDYFEHVWECYTRYNRSILSEKQLGIALEVKKPFRFLKIHECTPITIINASFPLEETKKLFKTLMNPERRS